MPTCKQKWRTYILPTPPETYGTTFFKNGHRTFCGFFFTTSLGILPPFSSTWCQVPHSRRLLLTSRGVRQFERLDRKENGMSTWNLQGGPQKHHPQQKKTSGNSSFFLGNVFFFRKKTAYFCFWTGFTPIFKGKNDVNKSMFRTFQNAKGFWGNKGWPPFLAPWILVSNLMEGISKFTPPTR